MTQYSGPNTTAPGDFVTARWGQLFGGLVRSCVLADAYSTALDVSIPTVSGQPGRMRLTPGAANVGGHLYATDANVDVDVPLNGNTNPRIVTFVLRKTRGSGLTVPGYVTGTPASNPTPPNLVDDAATLEVPIRDVSQPGSNGSLTTSRLRGDRRVFRHYPLQSARLASTVEISVGPGVVDQWRAKTEMPTVSFTPPPRSQVRFDWGAQIRHESGWIGRVGLALTGGITRPPVVAEAVNQQGTDTITSSTSLVLDDPADAATTAELQFWNSAGPGSAYFRHCWLTVTIIPRDM